MAEKPAQLESLRSTLRDQMDRLVADSLRDILDAARKARDFVGRMDRTAFGQDDRSQRYDHAGR